MKEITNTLLAAIVGVAAAKTSLARPQARSNGSTALPAGTPAPDFALKSSRIREDFRSGARHDVNGTPSFFLNGMRYDGAISVDDFLAALAARPA